MLAGVWFGLKNGVVGVAIGVLIAMLLSVPIHSLILSRLSGVPLAKLVSPLLRGTAILTVIAAPMLLLKFSGNLPLDQMWPMLGFTAVGAVVWFFLSTQVFPEVWKRVATVFSQFIHSKSRYRHQ